MLGGFAGITAEDPARVYSRGLVCAQVNRSIIQPFSTRKLQPRSSIRDPDGKAMGYVPLFPNDVFISYSHNDNESPDEDPGWVSEFANRLRIRVGQLLGTKAKVWRDPRLGPAEVLEAGILRELRASVVLVAVVSPSYQTSRWCRLEREAFQRSGASAAGVRVGDKIRILNVVKTPLPADEQRVIWPDAIECAFYARSEDTERIEEFAPPSAEFGSKLNDLAQEIASLLRDMRKLATVYLGQAPPAFEGQRAKLQQELEAQHFIVVPNATLPADQTRAGDAVRDAMDQACMSVHLVAVGAADEAVAATPAAALELEVAHERGLPRVVSVGRYPQPSGNAPSVIPSALGEPDDVMDVLLDKTLETIKETVLDRLTARAQPAIRQPSEPGELQRIYLICDRSDHPVFHENDARRIREHLHRLGFEVKLPVSDPSDPVEVRKDNREKLRQCDAVLIYWESPSDAWIEERLRELSKALGWRKTRKFSGKGVYVTHPKEPWKEQFESHEPDVVMKEWREFSPPALEPFINWLRQRRTPPHDSSSEP